MPIVAPAHPERAETRSYPGLVLASLNTSTYPPGRSCLGSSGVGGWKRVRLGVALAAALLDGHFEHPDSLYRL